jgi:hypothetical protein
MKNFIIYATLLVILFATKLQAQDSFQSRVKAIAEKIEKITKDEKSALKTEVEQVNVQLEKGTITKEQADEKKKKLAETTATNIENKVAEAQNELKELIQEKVDGKLSTNEKNNEISVNWKSKKDTIQKSEKRTTSQFVFAFGANNLATNNKISNSDFKYLGSHFYELGLTYNTRLTKNSNLLHVKYGLSFMFNNLRPTDNRVFEVNENQTNLEPSFISLKDSRFKNTYMVVPLHLEFDFSKNKTKDDKPFFKSHQGFRLGLGGYAGINLDSRQFTEYKIDGYKTKTETKGDFNTSDFIYGLSAYIGHQETSLYVKYDLNTMFKYNVVKQNNVSLGVRFDLN